MKKSRREFLRRALMGTAGLVAHRSLASELLIKKPESQIEKCDVIVIGAGMAGLIAARDLTFRKYKDLSGSNYKQRGFKTILLEGSQRIGGRIMTANSAEDIKRFGGPIEMGAEYIHREKGKVDLWKDVELYKIRTEEIDRMNDGLIYYDGWEDDLRSEKGAGLKWITGELFSSKFRFFDTAQFYKNVDNYSGPDISAKEWLDQQKFHVIGRNLVDLYFTGHIPGHLDEISIKGFASDRISEQELEDYEYGFIDGYSQFLDEIVKGRNMFTGESLLAKDPLSGREFVPSIDIRFGNTVNYIKYGPNGVEVRAVAYGKNGERQEKIYQADAVIITASVGMLKSGDITFDPILPQDKQDALHVMGMGDEAKMALKFSKRFWPEDAVILNRIDNNHEMARTYFVPFASDPEKNKTLVVLWAGEEADKIANMGDDEVIAALCRDFDKMFPTAAREAGGSIYNLIEKNSSGSLVYKTWQWSMDPLAKGSDSFLRVGVEKSVPVSLARRVLASPLTTPGIFWAGEATAFGEGTQPCSTHGAHFTGVRAAKEVIEYLTKIKDRKS